MGNTAKTRNVGRTDRTGWSEYDFKDRRVLMGQCGLVGLTDQPGQVKWPEHDRKDRTIGTGQLWQDGAAGTGQ